MSRYDKSNSDLNVAMNEVESKFKAIATMKLGKNSIIHFPFTSISYESRISFMPDA